MQVEREHGINTTCALQKEKCEYSMRNIERKGYSSRESLFLYRFQRPILPENFGFSNEQLDEARARFASIK